MTWSRFKPKGSKYGNRTTSGCQLGHSHRSKLEAAVCGVYYLEMLAGRIKTIGVERHTRVCGPRGHECSHKTKVDLVVDFVLDEGLSTEFFAEAKGMETTDYKIKRRLWIHNAIGRLEIWKGSWQRPTCAEVILG